jgi:peptidoglycan LD-endopeptidase LytH
MFLKVYKTLIVLFLPIFLQAQTSDSIVVKTSSKSINNAVGNFHFLYQSIREGSISERLAQDSVAQLLTEIKQYFIENGGVEDSPNDWFFPVEGYNTNMIGGKNGSDYIAGEYNFFNTSRIHVHPAHDIFIEDKNQDKLDDETNLPVNILSFTNGVVVSAEYFWEKDSPARGGNYIYIYEPFSRKIYYYAHNELVLVQIGDIVKAGQNIAVMGRSGFNAAKTRSPTHLHFSILKFDETTSIGIPIKPFSVLLQAKKTKKLR